MTDDMTGPANADVSYGGDLTGDDAQDISAETSEDLSDEAPVDMEEDVTVDIPHDVPEGTDVPEGGADGLPEDVEAETGVGRPEDIDEISEDVPETEASDAPSDFNTGAPEDLPEDTTADRPHDGSDKTPEDLEEDTALYETSDDIPEDTFNPLERLNESNQNALEYHEQWNRGDLNFEPSETGKSTEFISPFSIAQPEGLNEGNFWDHHGNDRDTYARAAADVPEVVRALSGGASLDDLRADGQYRETLDSFWSTGDPISVVKYGDSYLCDAGRHRVAAAQDLGLEAIPVSVKGTFRNK
jgi:hypothetical protein